MFFFENRSLTELYSYSARKVIRLLANLNHRYSLVAQRCAGEITCGFTYYRSERRIAVGVRNIVSSPVKIVHDTVSEMTTQEHAWPGESLAPGGTLVVFLDPIVDKTNYKDIHTDYDFRNLHVPKNMAFRESLYSNLARLVGAQGMFMTPSETVNAALKTFPTAG